MTIPDPCFENRALSVQQSGEDAAVVPETSRVYIKKAPCLAAGRFEMSYVLAYQVLVPWHAGAQELAVELKFKELTTFVVPLLCVAAFTVVEL